MLKSGMKWLRMGAFVALTVLAPLSLFGSSSLSAAEGEKPVERTYVAAPAARLGMTDEEVEAANQGCVSCHTDSDAKTMHMSQAVKLS